MAAKSRITLDTEAMAFERKGETFTFTLAKEFFDKCAAFEIEIPDTLKRATLHGFNQKVVDSIASMGGSEYTDDERTNVMKNVAMNLNNDQWSVRAERKDVVSKATFAKIYNVPELRLLAKIAPMVLTAEQKAILEWADSNEKDLYLSKHPELKDIIAQIEDEQIAAEIEAAEKAGEV